MSTFHPSDWQKPKPSLSPPCWWGYRMAGIYISVTNSMAGRITNDKSKYPLNRHFMAQIYLAQIYNAICTSLIKREKHRKTSESYKGWLNNLWNDHGWNSMQLWKKEWNHRPEILGWQSKVQKRVCSMLPFVTKGRDLRFCILLVYAKRNAGKNY